MNPKPIYALADSRLLFWKKDDGSLFLRKMIGTTGVSHPRIAYVGASNSDQLEYYHGIFEPAMQEMPCCRCRMILSRPRPKDGEFLEQADAILLAGGSVEAGWRTFEKNGFRELILRRFYEGVTLIGVSAGAVQLGEGGLSDDGKTLLKTFGLLPFYVGVHEEKQQWKLLRKTLGMVQGMARGVGIPSGAGFVYNAGELEPIGDRLHEYYVEDGRIREDWIRSQP